MLIIVLHAYLNSGVLKIHASYWRKTGLHRSRIASPQIPSALCMLQGYSSATLGRRSHLNAHDLTHQTNKGNAHSITNKVTGHAHYCNNRKTEGYAN